MYHKNNLIQLFALLTAGVILLSACGAQGTQTALAETPTPGLPLTAVLSELAGTVQAKEPTATDYQDARTGMLLAPQGQVKTGVDGRARLDLSTGTIIRISPSSVFTLTSNEKVDGSLLTRIKMESGKLWIILKGGSAEVETPSGQASVRGSYMSVEVNPGTFEVTITCLEGDCGGSNPAGELNTFAGGVIKLQFDPATTKFLPPVGSQMTPEQIQEWLDNNPEAQGILNNAYATMTALPTATPTATATPQPTDTPVSYGPDQYPPGINPLTGLPVENPDDLKFPSVLISIPEFPVSARPQSGLSSASWIYEIYIGDGESRMMASFYGTFPGFGDFLKGDCEVRAKPFEASNSFIGNRVWNDKNKNGQQDQWEKGIGGICVDLYDAGTNELLQSTSTNSNGFYGFNVEAGRSYQVEVRKPASFIFTTPNAAPDDKDSDMDPVSGRTPPFAVKVTDLNLDAGLIVDDLPNGPTPTNVPGGGINPPGQLGTPRVGPIRSGRVVYGYLAGAFQDSCLIYASGDPSVVKRLPKCHFQFGSDTGDINSAFVDVTRMRELSEQNKNPDHEFNYGGNTFSDVPPAGGSGPVNEIQVFWNIWNQVLWRFDPLSGMWQRYRDLGQDNPKNGTIPWVESTDRLNGQQLIFSNIIFLLADHVKEAQYIFDVKLEQGSKGKAILFRDGQRYDILWTTVSGEYEKTTGLRRPLRYTDLDGNPIALKPGPSWVYVWTPFSGIEEGSPGSWFARFIQP